MYEISSQDGPIRFGATPAGVAPLLNVRSDLTGYHLVLSALMQHPAGDAEGMLEFRAKPTEVAQSLRELTNSLDAPSKVQNLSDYLSKLPAKLIRGVTLTRIEGDVVVMVRNARTIQKPEEPDIQPDSERATSKRMTVDDNAGAEAGGRLVPLRRSSDYEVLWALFGSESAKSIASIVGGAIEKSLKEGNKLPNSPYDFERRFRLFASEHWYSQIDHLREQLKASKIDQQQLVAGKRLSSVWLDESEGATELANRFRRIAEADQAAAICGILSAVDMLGQHLPRTVLTDYLLDLWYALEEGSCGQCDKCLSHSICDNDPPESSMIDILAQALELWKLEPAHPPKTEPRKVAKKAIAEYYKSDVSCSVRIDDKIVQLYKLKGLAIEANAYRALIRASAEECLVREDDLKSASKFASQMLQLHAHAMGDNALRLLKAGVSTMDAFRLDLLVLKLRAKRYGAVETYERIVSTSIGAFERREGMHEFVKQLNAMKHAIKFDHTSLLGNEDSLLYNRLLVQAYVLAIRKLDSRHRWTRDDKADLLRLTNQMGEYAKSHPGNVGNIMPKWA